MEVCLILLDSILHTLCERTDVRSFRFPTSFLNPLRLDQKNLGVGCIEECGIYSVVVGAIPYRLGSLFL